MQYVIIVIRNGEKGFFSVSYDVDVIYKLAIKHVRNIRISIRHNSSPYSLDTDVLSL